MNFQLSEINRRIVSDPAAFVAECDERYDERIKTAADRITANLKNSRIVLLSGPSGSGKTTTAMKIEDELKKRGVGSHSIGMDDYYRTLDHKTAPKTPEGETDLESPLLLDMDLMNEHFTMLERGEKIYVPKYEFSRQMRIFEPSRSLRLGKDEIAIFEGIHALNDELTTRHPEAFKLYISAQSSVMDGDTSLFKGTWMRLLRRTVRDKLFRGADPAYTLSLWANVRRGETQYISPFREKADLQFDSAFPYEVSVLGPMAVELFEQLPKDTQRYTELHNVFFALERFETLDERFLAPDALLREFIGGGIYSY